MIFFVTGASGSSKSACLPQLLSEHRIELRDALRRSPNSGHGARSAGPSKRRRHADIGHESRGDSGVVAAPGDHTEVAALLLSASNSSISSLNSNMESELRPPFRRRADQRPYGSTSPVRARRTPSLLVVPMFPTRGTLRSGLRGRGRSGTSWFGIGRRFGWYCWGG